MRKYALLIKRSLMERKLFGRDNKCFKQGEVPQKILKRNMTKENGEQKIKITYKERMTKEA